jgi:maltooligosyltrehalose trehalohydrolase
MKIGADYIGDGRCEFIVWAPQRMSVEIRFVGGGRPPVAAKHPGGKREYFQMKQDDNGYWTALVEDIFPGARYFYRLDNERERPDPASHFQPDGVHGPSQIIDHGSFKWTDKNWKGIPLREMIMYELHAGAFTKEGTFDAIVPVLDYLNDLGVNAIEIMPVVQFTGERNWGYDGTYPFAVQNSYGGPDGLKRLVNACHKNGTAVILDVVYNHLGPEGNYLWDFAPYFTDKYRTPWGQAINFDDAYSNDVRNYFIENALHWFRHYHIDALRLDAVHGITDMSAVPFLQELACRVEEFSEREGRKCYLIAESDLNDSRLIRPKGQGGFCIDAQWNDDFHHCIHTLLTGEKDGYYIDFGKMSHLIKSMREGYVYSGGYSVYRKRNHGNSSKDIPAHKFVVFSQNHDQVGNRAAGDRPGQNMSFEKLKLAAGLVLLSPYIPLLFMGEEYGETAPFQYFVSHSDEHLIEAVRKGRREEFASFGWEGEIPDPQAESTFLDSKINIGLHKEGRHNALFRFYKELIRLRKEVPALSHPSRDNMEVTHIEGEGVLFVRRRFEYDEVFCQYNFNEKGVGIKSALPSGAWEKILDSSSEYWGENSGLQEEERGPLGPEIPENVNPYCFVVYRMIREVK